MSRLPVTWLSVRSLYAPHVLILCRTDICRIGLYTLHSRRSAALADKEVSVLVEGPSPRAQRSRSVL